LINKVFGVEKGLAVSAHIVSKHSNADRSPQQQVAHDGPGKANIDVGLYSNDNDRFILHDSEGFEPGEDAKLNTVKRFIENRSKTSQLKERLHAIW
jgi:hypothetical protein